MFEKKIKHIAVLIVLAAFIYESKYNNEIEYLRELHQINLNNTAYGILCSSILFSVGYLISGVKDPIMKKEKIY